jgi:hypothetical protein
MGCAPWFFLPEGNNIFFYSGRPIFVGSPAQQDELLCCLVRCKQRRHARNVQASHATTEITCNEGKQDKALSSYIWFQIKLIKPWQRHAFLSRLRCPRHTNTSIHCMPSPALPLHSGSWRMFAAAMHISATSLRHNAEKFRTQRPAREGSEP